MRTRRSLFCHSDNAAAMGGFTPTSLPNLALWLDTAFGVFIERSSPSTPCGNRDPVGTWIARTGQAFVAPSDASRLTYNTNSGKPYLDYNGVNGYLFCISTTLFDGAMTTVMRVRQNLTSPNTVMLGGHIVNALGLAVSAGPVLAGYQVGVLGRITSSSCPLATDTTLTYKSDGGMPMQVFAKADSQTFSPLSLMISPSPTTAAGIGNYANLDNPLNGRIYGMSHYKRVLSVPELALIESYYAGLS